MDPTEQQTTQTHRPSKLFQDEIRVMIADYPELNRLIGDLEFSPERIENAMKFCIRQYNEMPPPITRVPEDPETFPFPDLLLRGTLAKLLLGKALEKNRNRLAYSTDGVSIDDQAMADIYIQIGNQLNQEFRADAKSIRVSINIAAGFGQVPSEYGRRYLFRGDFIR